MKRRSLLRLAALPGALGLFGASPVRAQFRVEISGVGGTQVPIAVQKFRDEDKMPQGTATAPIVRADLERSGAFRMVDGGTPLDETGQPNMSEWRGKSTDALLVGSATRLADGRFDLRYKLWDVVKGAEIGAQATAVDPAELRLAAHRIADFVYQKLTGDKGVFSTRIAYVSKGGGRYTLRVADSDGEGGQVAVNSAEPLISPAWSPDGRELAYVSFEKQDDIKKAVVYAQELATGKRRIIANFRGSNSAPAWSIDGKDLAVTSSKDGGSQLYLISRNGDNVRRLTTSQAIDTEPVFAPDGRGIYFVSDRGGGPQIYRTLLTGTGTVTRVTFVGNYNISPAISPDGRTMAYISRLANGAFRLHTLDLTSNAQPVALTDTNDDESPSFAPNGRLIVYASRAQGRDILMTTTLDGKIKARLVTSAEVREPVWGPYGR